MHLIVSNVTGVAEVNRVDDFVVAVGLITVQVLGLTAMSCETISIT